MAANQHIRDVVDVATPLFAGEAEVVRTYFDWSGRTAETDRKWIGHQCFKEFYGSGYGEPEHGIIVEWGQWMIDRRPELDKGMDRHEMLELVEGIYAEYHHYCLFADIYDNLGASGEAKLTPNMLSNWPEGKTLDDYRLDLRQTHGDLGQAAMDFTEGGYCTLYSEGTKLKGRGGIDDQIAAACQRVYDDEVGHMLKGVTALGSYELDEEGWNMVKERVIGQLQRRIVMRNGQFSFPLSQERIDAIYAGDIEPIDFDYSIMEKAA
ncbi:MAG: hypothetical protein HOM58_05385 [Rhodospirillaceae bacterium]|jgi:hypothetical protein|nr:hypothetical protein [Rhodospirillaceae bacterium]MBT5459398.1 hypothetical protein [Rhodospirillaceae bacterium]